MFAIYKAINVGIVSPSMIRMHQIDSIERELVKCVFAKPSNGSGENCFRRIPTIYNEHITIRLIAIICSFYPKIFGISSCIDCRLGKANIAFAWCKFGNIFGLRQDTLIGGRNSRKARSKIAANNKIIAKCSYTFFIQRFIQEKPLVQSCIAIN